MRKTVICHAQIPISSVKLVEDAFWTVGDVMVIFSHISCSSL